MIIEFGITGHEGLTQELVDELAPFLIEGEVLLRKELEKNSNPETTHKWHSEYESYTGEFEECRDILMRHKRDMVLRSSRDTPAGLYLNVANSLSEIKKLLQRPATIQETFNEKCSVHISGLGLLEIRNVVVEKDLCTHYLQDFLNKGWKIIAVCPQPDQRRPDYILGRNTMEID